MEQVSVSYRVAIAALIVNAACAATPVACEPSALVAAPMTATPKGVGVGPLFCTGFGDNDVAKIRWSPGQIDKVVIWHLEPTGRALVVRGERCEDRRSLRFWFREGIPAVIREDPQIVERVGTDRLDIEPASAETLAALTLTHGGYFLFAGPGRWRIGVWHGDRQIGSFVVGVSLR